MDNFYIIRSSCLSFQYLGLGLKIFICLSHVNPCISTCLGCLGLKKICHQTFMRLQDSYIGKKINLFSVVYMQMKISFVMQWMGLNDSILTFPIDTVEGDAPTFLGLSVSKGRNIQLYLM